MIIIDFRYLELNADKYKIMLDKLNNNRGPEMLVASVLKTILVIPNTIILN